MEEKVLEKISARKIDAWIKNVLGVLSKNKGDSNSCKNDGWDDLIQGEFFFGRKILEKKLPGGKSSGKRWGQTEKVQKGDFLNKDWGELKFLFVLGSYESLEGLER